MLINDYKFYVLNRLNLSISVLILQPSSTYFWDDPRTYPFARIHEKNPHLTSASDIASWPHERHLI